MILLLRLSQKTDQFVSLMRSCNAAIAGVEENTLGSESSKIVKFLLVDFTSLRWS